MKIAVVGSGYVGLVTGACLANLGNQVVCVDKDKKRIGQLKKGKIPFYEPGLPELVSKNLKAKRIAFTADLSSAVLASEVIFIAVGTPAKDDGEADISAVVSVAEGIAAALRKSKIQNPKSKNLFKVIVNKSTVPVGMGDIVSKILIQSGIAEESFSVVSNPEFLREGSAISDFMKPDRIVIGAGDNRAFNIITELYRPLNAHIIFTSVKSAELIKYASNAFLAAKISFINEIANICDLLGSDVSEVANAMGLDKRIGREFLNAGLGYGGSCLPKDVSALIQLSKSVGYNPKLLESVNNLNSYQIESFITRIKSRLKNLKDKKIALLGLSFKPETDDLRDAPSLKIIEALKACGAKIFAYDPACGETARRQVKGVNFCANVYDAIKSAEAIVIATEWPEFRELDFDKVKKISKGLIFDGRNIYDKERMKEAGIEYIGVGR